MGEFLVEHQAVTAPIIEWGGLFLLLAIVLSPFLIILHPRLRPTRWWHIAGAYLSSFVLYLGVWYLIDLLDQWLLQNLFSTFELYSAYSGTLLKIVLWPVLIYPLFVFYSTKLLYGKFTRKRFYLNLAIFLISALTLAIGLAYIIIILIGQAFTNLL